MADSITIETGSLMNLPKIRCYYYDTSYISVIIQKHMLKLITYSIFKKTILINK